MKLYYFPDIIIGVYFFGVIFVKKANLRPLVASALLGAVGFILMMLEFSLPFMPSFIKFDFSELPALIAAFAYGPFFGVLVCFIKNAIHLFFTGTMGVGELANFLMGVVFVLVAGFIYKYRKRRSGALIGSLSGSVAMGVACVLINFFIVYPIYYKLLMPQEVILSFYQTILPSVDNIFDALLIFNLPFTTAKGIIDAIICFLIYKKISPILKKN